VAHTSEHVVTETRGKGRLGRLRELLGRLFDAIRWSFGERRERLNRYAIDRMLYSNERVTIGRHSYGDPLVATFPGDTASVRIGSFTSIGPDVILMDGGNHRTDWVTTFPFRVSLDLEGAYEDGHPTSRGDIEIGNDVWVGRGARVLSGVKIGNGAVVGGYAVVARDVRPYAIVVGNPAREVRRRFTDEQVEALERIAWWDWPMDDVLRTVPRLCSDEVDAFIEEYLPAPEPRGTMR
jgi:acetyltransferase-like isoleucine patch superfamily enzyme